MVKDLGVEITEFKKESFKKERRSSMSNIAEYLSLDVLEASQTYHVPRRTLVPLPSKAC